MSFEMAMTSKAEDSRHLFRFHLSSGIVVFIAGSILLGLYISPGAIRFHPMLWESIAEDEIRRPEFGWPVAHGPEEWHGADAYRTLRANGNWQLGVLINAGDQRKAKVAESKQILSGIIAILFAGLPSRVG